GSSIDELCNFGRMCLVHSTAELAHPSVDSPAVCTRRFVDPGLARLSGVNAGTAAHDAAPRSPAPDLAEPRAPCPRAGAHVIVEGRIVDRILMACPVCGLRWSTERSQDSNADTDQRSKRPAPFTPE